jgi:hypothetical protein
VLDSSTEGSMGRWVAWSKVEVNGSPWRAGATVRARRVRNRDA